MRFDFDAYKKVYPDEPAPAAPIESAVDTFKPTESEMAKDKKPGAEDLSSVPEPTPEPAPDTTKLTEPPAPEGEKDE